jgi:hypothetical protein
MIANLTLFPNQIIVIYNFFLFVYGISLAGFDSYDIKMYIKRLLLPILYVVVFIIVSYFGVNFAFSVKYHVLYLPLDLVNFSIWYFLGRFYDAQSFMSIFYRTVSIYGITILFFAMFGLVDPELTRVISGVDLSLAIPLSILNGDILFSGIIFALSLFSIKKTVVLGVLIGYIAVQFYSKKFNFNSFQNFNKVAGSIKKIRKSKIISAFLLMFLSGLLIILFTPFLIATVYRFGDNTDAIRMSIAAEFIDALFTHFPNGTGYYTFGYLTGDIIQYSSTMANGDVLTDGVTLHNSFMHFALEGGLLILIIVFLLYRSYFKTIKFFLKWPETKYLGIVFVCWFIVTFFYGLFQQYHASRYFLGIFGLAFGVYEKFKKIKKQSTQNHLVIKEDEIYKK